MVKHRTSTATNSVASLMVVGSTWWILSRVSKIPALVVGHEYDDDGIVTKVVHRDERKGMHCDPSKTKIDAATVRSRWVPRTEQASAKPPEAAPAPKQSSSRQEGPATALTVIPFDGDTLRATKLDGKVWVTLASLLKPFGKRVDKERERLGWANLRQEVVTYFGGSARRAGERLTQQMWLVDAEQVPMVVAKLETNGMTEVMAAKHVRYIQRCAEVLYGAFTGATGSAPAPQPFDMMEFGKVVAVVVITAMAPLIREMMGVRAKAAEEPETVAPRARVMPMPPVGWKSTKDWLPYVSARFGKAVSYRTFGKAVAPFRDDPDHFTTREVGYTDEKGYHLNPKFFYPPAVVEFVVNALRDEVLAKERAAADKKREQQAERAAQKAEKEAERAARSST